MVYSVLQYVLFLVCFAASFYALSNVQFEKFCKVSNPKKIYVLLFLLSLIMGYLASQAILSLTVLNGFY
jgi:uncharacterized integral membrane protein (TIGR02327 family)